MKDKFSKILLGIIAAGIWMIVLQNFNVFDNKQDVYVRGGYIDIAGGYVSVSGSVSVDNTVDVNIDEVLGRPAAAYRAYTDKYGKQHNALGVVK
ncbi:MAG: hypothetical protein H8D45_26535 [Bacteroidetes bacterium]|nr:hypothetical protein [Bacteroidota bacterium]